MNADAGPASPTGVVRNVSRREVLRGGAAALGVLSGIGLLDQRSALALGSSGPRPIPGGFNKSLTMAVPKHAFIHVLPPGIGSEMSTITNFNGVVGGSEIRGRAHGSDGTSYDFDTDMRFMQGTYVGLDGRMRHGSFGFV
jgi:hypothetical protein